jgi:hypothetical protein
MKKNTLFCGVLTLAMLACLVLSGCEPLEQGIGTIKLINNSQNVIVVYWSLERGSKTLWEGDSTIYPGGSASHNMETDVGIKVYVEDKEGDGWLSDDSYTVKKNETVEVKFPTDFSPEP